MSNIHGMGDLREREAQNERRNRRNVDPEA